MVQRPDVPFDKDMVRVEFISDPASETTSAGTGLSSGFVHPGLTVPGDPDHQPPDVADEQRITTPERQAASADAESSPD